MTAAAPALGGVRVAAQERARWGWAQWLAVLAIPIAFLETWTLIAWLTDDAHQLTAFRERGHTSAWWAAQAFQGVFLLVDIAMLVYVVRGCRRERRLTFDALFCLAGLTLFWADLDINFFVPVQIFSSDLINLNTPLGHLPGVVNPDIGRVPDPIFLGMSLESFGLLLGAVGGGALIRWIRTQSPDISMRRLLTIVLGLGMFLDLLFEVPAIAFHLWTYAAPSWMSLPLGSGGMRLPLVEVLAAGSFFAVPVAMRDLKDDRGRTFVERGMDTISGPRRSLITFAALYTVMQVVVWIPANLPDMAFGFYEQAWPRIPAHVVNDVCDAPGISGTRYGPCPGSPGYRMPTRGSLPGPNP